jgi:hypothetical protein
LGIGISDRLGAFLEGYAEIPQNEAWQPVIDSGITFLLILAINWISILLKASMIMP